MRKYFITAILLSLTSICFAQQPTIVFDQEGRIIKNYGIEKNGNEYTFLIEGVRSSDSDKYYLIYQWRDDYLYGANNTFEGNSAIQFEKFNDLGYLKVSDVLKNDNKIDPLLSYQLIKVNKSGKNFLDDCIIEEKPCNMTLNGLETKIKVSINARIDDFTTIETIAIKNNFFEDLSNFIKNINNFINNFNELNNLIRKLLKLELHEERLEELENKKEQGTISDEYIKLLRDKSLLEKKLKIREQQLEKLQGNTKECCTADNIDEVTEQIIELTKEIQSNEEKINVLLKDHEILITTERRKISSLKNEIENIIISEINIDISPVYTFLHQGVLISKSEKRFEIVYDVKNQRLFDSGKNRFNIARLTPDLPQLTTESELYMRILNLSSSELDENPFVISMESSLSAEVAIESPANFRPLQSVEIGSSFPDINLDTLEKVKSFIASQRDTSDKKKEMLKSLEKLIIKSQDQKDIDDRVEAKFGELNLNQKIKMAKDYINKIISSNLNKDPNYTDYLLKYPKAFEPFKSPSIALKTVQPEAENFSQKVENGKLKTESYDIKYVTKTLVADTLPPVHRLYRFALNTGLVASWDVSYSYHRTPLPNSSVDQLSERKDVAFQIRPILTLSTYFKKQDLAVDQDFFKGWHIDIGLDYAQKNIFDDFYVGLGFEPARLINFGIGCKFSKIKKVDPKKLDPATLDFSSAMTSKTIIRPFFSVNLGLNIIPTAISTLIK